jgi:hypothetical protein
LEKENKTLLQKNTDQGRVIDELRSQLFESQQKLKNSSAASKKQKLGPPPVNPRNLTNNQARNPIQNANDTAQNANDTESRPWNAVAGTKPFGAPKKVKKASPKHIEAISRGFSQVSGPQGYEYIYMHKSRKFTRSQVRDNLRLLGVEPSRILDVCFPARGVLGVLIHVQFKEDLLTLLSKHKISVVSDFDPLDPKHIADPNYADRGEAARADLAQEIQWTRCIRALYYLQKKMKPMKAVATSFMKQGWIAEDDLDKMSRFADAETFFLDRAGDDMNDYDDDEF